MTATAESRRAAAPWPLVKLYRHPLRWVHNLVFRVVAAVVLAHIGTLVIVAVYYLGTQKIPAVKHWWDTTVEPSTLRHSIRDVAEGVLGGLLAKAIVWNHYKNRNASVIERSEHRARVPKTLVAPFLALIYGAVAFTVIYYTLHYAGVHATQTSHGTHASWWARTKPIWTSDWDKKATGFVVAFIASRPLFPVFDSVQLWFVERRVALNKRLFFYHPAPFQARYNELKDSPVEVVSHGTVISRVMIGGLLLALGLAAYGYYVLAYLA